jgi:hypothetical protein
MLMPTPEIDNGIAAAPTAPQSVRGRNTEILMVILLLILAASFTITTIARLHRLLYISHIVVEDAFYYIVPAMHFADNGILALDGRNATNGFHPLWMICNCIFASLTRNRFILMYCVSFSGLAAAAVGTWLQCRSVCEAAIERLVLVALVLCSPLLFYWLSGMESGLAFLLLSLLYWWVARHSDTPWAFGDSLKFGFLSAMVVLSRLDFVMLIVILMGILVISRPQQGVMRLILGIVSGCLGPGLLYGLWNYKSFGMLGTVSAAAKQYYASHAGRNGFAHLAENVSGFYRNLNELLCGPVSRLFDTPDSSLHVRAGVFGAAAILALAGLWSRFQARETGGVLCRRLALGFILFALIHALTYSWIMGHFARDAYISWYFVPQIFALCLLLPRGVYAVAKGWKSLNSAATSLLTGIVLTIVIAAGGLRTIFLSGQREVSTYVRAGLFVNLVTPENARIGAFSAGTQAFLAYGGRTVTNLDGLINSPTFLKQYMIPGRLRQYLQDQHISFFSDHAGDLFTEDLVWSESRIPSSQIDVIGQCASWGGGFFNIARILDPGVARTSAFNRRHGKELGQYYAERGSGVVTVEAAWSSDGGLIFPGEDAPAMNAFGCFALQPGYYKVIAEISLIWSDGNHPDEEPALRLSFASWPQHVTHGERTLNCRELHKPGHRMNIALFTRVNVLTSMSEIRVTKLIKGLTVTLHETQYLRFPTEMPGIEFEESMAAIVRSRYR